MTVLLFTLMGMVALLLLVMYFLGARQDRTRERLIAGVHETDEEEVSLWRDAADLLQLEAIQNLLSESVLTRRLDYLIKVSAFRFGLLASIGLMVLVAAIGAGVAYVLTHMWLVSIGVVLVVPILFFVVLNILAQRRIQRHDAQLPAMVSQLITALRSGGTPTQAMQAAAQNAPSPVRESMASLLNTIQLGRPGPVAWREWDQFWNTRATNLLAMAIRLKWDTGGQMVTILEHVRATLEFHHRMELRVRTITAQAKLGAYFLSVLPFLIGAIMYAVRPEPIDSMLADPIGIKIVAAGLVLLVIGFFWMRKLAKLSQ